MFRVVISDDRFGDSKEELAVFEGMDVELSVAPDHSEEALAVSLRDADAVLVNQARIGKRLVAAMPRCRVLSRYGIGFDNVDVEAATSAGIWVANVPGYCANEVAEHALALLFACARRLRERDAAVRAGGWNLALPVRRVSGSVLGIVGFGASGRALHERARGLGFARILVHDPRVERKLFPGEFGEPASLDRVLAESDYVSLHLPLNAETRRIIGEEAIASMKRGAVLVNCARGGLVDEAALAAALREGRLAGAGLDVLDREPPDPANPLLSLPNVVLSDHSAYYSVESVSELKACAAENVREVLKGQRPRYPVNRPFKYA